MYTVELQGDFMKKFIISLIILVLVFSFVFLWGWTEFFVPVDKYGVMVSKTSGIKNEVIRSGNFSWSWERLIPTNTKLYVFSANPQTHSKNIAGTLPSAQIYSNMLEGNPDFSYNFSVDIILNILPDELPSFVDSTGANNQEDLDAYLKIQAETIAHSTIQYILEQSISDIDYVIEASYSNTQLIDAIHAQENFPNLSISTIKVNNIALPDISMYNLAKNTFMAYQEAIQVTLTESAEIQSTQATEHYLELERLTQIGKVIAEYPQLIDYLAVTNGNYSVAIPTNNSQ